MSLTTGAAADEMSQAEVLPQLDASSLVDPERLEAEVKAVYRHVARGDAAELHFEVGMGHAAATEVAVPRRHRADAGTPPHLGAVPERADPADFCCH